MTYLEFRKAIEMFGLEDRATLEQIKARHRELVRSHHPDHSSDDDPEIIRKINAAHEIIRAYCERYRYCFSEEAFMEQNPEERLRRQFDYDPVWSGKAESGQEEP